ncbi:MAG: PQQ-binding-like beta-propeller repeat protein, partial [Pirellulales bacterium]|nr:PQQ-binding-like beta-propeller repeat protein [Pirellulales bacterium]
KPGPSPQAAPVAAASPGWPVFRGNPQATGTAPCELAPQLEMLWTFSTEHDNFENAVAIVDGTVYAGSLGGNLYAIDLAGGTEKWRSFTKLGFTAAPAVHGGSVYLGDAEGRFYCLDTVAGKPKW